MESVNIQGDLFPRTDISVELANQSIILIFTAPSGTQQTFEAQTDTEGSYELTQPFVPNEVGKWEVEARFAGNDQLIGTEGSDMFTVTKGIALVTFQSGETGILGTQFEVIAQLSLPLEDEPVTLRILAPDKAVSTLTNITTSMRKRDLMIGTHWLSTNLIWRLSVPVKVQVLRNTLPPMPTLQSPANTRSFLTLQTPTAVLKRSKRQSPYRVAKRLGMSMGMAWSTSLIWFSLPETSANRGRGFKATLMRMVWSTSSILFSSPGISAKVPLQLRPLCLVSFYKR
jgi:hypothetical protein